LIGFPIKRRNLKTRLIASGRKWERLARFRNHFVSLLNIGWL
jgi:hypothetical protein